jgi:uncharacterized protein with HEPN domain
MSRHDDETRLRHMLEFASTAIGFADGKSRADLDADQILQFAIIRAVEVIGEAAGRVSTELREAHPEIPWHQIKGTRNRLSHGYDQVDLDILWTIVSQELQPLVERLKLMLPDDGA